jgi:Ca-activated chloride channel homolog
MPLHCGDSCLRICLLATALLCPAWNATAQEPTAQAEQAIRVSVARVNVGVVVTDEKGQFVEGLARAAFHVFDNSAAQPITEFAPIEEPAQVLLLLEAGPAVYLLQDAHLFVADSLLNGLSAGDRVAIAQYNDAPVGVLEFTTDKRAARSALDTVQFNLGFAQLNLASSLNSVLDWLQQIPGKKTIVLVSTGVDTSPQDAIVALQNRLPVGETKILCISMTGPLRNGNKGSKAKILQTQEEFALADQRLRAIAEATGGRAFFPENAKAVQETYEQIAQIVRHEYSLAFAPPAADGKVHAIDVRVDSSKSEKTKTPSYQVDHRKAYVAPKE